MNQAAFLAEPEASYVAMLTLATSMHDFLTVGGGADAFGDQQQLAVDASRSWWPAAVELGDSFLSREAARARHAARSRSWSRQRPIRGEFVAEQVQSLVMSTAASPMFDWVTEIPLSPFRALQGVDQGAQAIREFNETALEFSRTVAGDAAPDPLEPRAARARRQPAGRIGASLENFDALARSAESISVTAAALPETLRELLAEAERTGQTLEPLSASLERSATAVAAAGAAWGGLVEELASRPRIRPSEVGLSTSASGSRRRRRWPRRPPSCARCSIPPDVAGSTRSTPPIAELTAQRRSRRGGLALAGEPCGAGAGSS